jgi:Leucine-rich repeat (LRR) protein
VANLEAIDPDSNNISGSIHSKVGSLTGLRYLTFLPINNGSILYEIGNMENLKTLDLSSNNVHGSVPSMMCNLKALCPWVFHGLIPRLVGPLFHK